jgi:hypothetical protein
MTTRAEKPLAAAHGAGHMITVQNSQVAKITKEEFESGKYTAPTIKPARQAPPRHPRRLRLDPTRLA